MKQAKVAIIVPTIREASFKKFLKQWRKEFSTLSKKYDFSLYVIEDNPVKSFKITKKYPCKILHFSWKEIDKQLNEKSWIIPRRSDAVRSFAVFISYRDKNEYFITLDDDCYPFYNEKNKPGYFIKSHIKNLTSFEYTQPVWSNTIKGLIPRGYPFMETGAIKTITNAVISHGLWVNVPDLDSVTSLSLSQKNQYFDHIVNQVIPSHNFFPMSSMNLAWKREVSPLIYFLLMGQDGKGNKYDYDRFGDIWCGFFAKKIIDKLGYSVVSGDPCVYHERASNHFDNLIKEANGIKQNEQLWKDIYSMELTKNSLKDLYKELAIKIPEYSPYWLKLKNAMNIWIELF